MGWSDGRQKADEIFTANFQSPHTGLHRHVAATARYCSRA
ncbi:hypothetical protein [Klebsiella pneumoniae]|nr:hypothetical protein [Klebsiella pneumoniae]